MKNALIFLMLFVCISLSGQVSLAGCTLSGGMGIYSACNNGQGCTSGCDLSTTYGGFGPMCNGTVNNGNCFGSASGGHQTMSTAFTLPAGCTGVITAEFKKRGGSCTNSGMDANDKLGINNMNVYGTNTGNCGNGTSTPGITLAGCLGSANADVSCSLTQTGGTILIWGSANRSDEIVTYTISLSGSCGASCSGVLPIKLTDFSGVENDGSILLKWNVSTETDVSYYQLEKSRDGINFIPFQTIQSIAGSSGNTNLSYFGTDFTPEKGINYYKLLNVNLDGTKNESKIISVLYDFKSGDQLFLNVSAELVNIILGNNAPIEDIIIRDMSGRIVKILKNDTSDKVLSFNKSELANGLYLVGFQATNNSLKKLLLQ
ncbi:MAG: T9SS type A sorting domain-containing protein [Bacteroidetes bacterium]|nr:T9SS type A sorting domain-containing protein [Bacteroidota bacterium]